MLLLTSTITELRSDSGALLSAETPRTQGKVTCRQSSMFDSNHAFLNTKKYHNNGTFRKIPETMSLFEMRFFQNNLSTGWHKGNSRNYYFVVFNSSFLSYLNVGNKQIAFQLVFKDMTRYER